MHFDHYIRKWQLTPDGQPIVTRSSRLLPVRWQGLPAMLKIAVEAEEQAGNQLMIWWNGKGAAAVLAHEENILLLERAEGRSSLAAMARGGQDDAASRILCAVVAHLHRPRSLPAPAMIPLPQWFRDLEAGADKHGGIFPRCAATARQLLATQQDVVVLHGDIHHANVLDFGARGWLAIDPKCLLGERGFDYANIFCNPDMQIAITPGRLLRQMAVISEAAALERQRLLQWVFAWAGLSAIWSIQDGDDPATALAVAEIAAAAL